MSKYSDLSRRMSEIAQCSTDGPAIKEAAIALRELEAENERLLTALTGLVGCDNPDELRAMELAVRSMPVPDADKAATINAIHALLAAREE